MEVKPGYKLTEIGPIPHDWSISQLGLCLKTRPSYGINAAAVPYSDQLPTYIRITDISDDGRFSPSPRVSVSSDSSGDYVLADGDIVFARTGASVGKSYRYRPCDGPLVYAGFLIRVTPEPSKLLPAFASAFATTGSYWRWVRLMSMRSGQPGINGKEYAQLPLPIPPLPEQRAIAQALGDVDELIDAVDRLIAKKRDIKQATMQQLLTGKTRLPGFSGKWEMKQVASFTNCVAGGTPSTLVRSYWDGSIKWMSSGDLHLKRVKDVPGRITQAGLDNSAATILPKQCVLIGLAGQGKTRGTVAINLTELSTNQSIGAILPNGTFVPDYLFHNLDRRYTELRELSSGGGRGGLNLKLLGSLEIPLPSIHEQAAIASVLSDMDAQISALEARRNKTRALKQGMMQELLTGKTRLI